MRDGYAQLHNNEDELSSSKLFFSNILDTDWIFRDHESDMHAMAAMLRKVQKNDQVVLQSRSDCGLSAGEIHELEQLLLKKKVRFFFALFEPEVELATEKIEEKSLGQIATEQGVVKKHRKIRKPLDHNLFAELYQLYKSREITKGEMAKKLGITYPTLQNRLQQYEAGVIA